MPKLKVALLMGGTSSEHAVSLSSASEVFNNIDRTKYSVVCIQWRKDNSWVAYKTDSITEIVSEYANAAECFLSVCPDIVFSALHGVNGEDGKIQGFFEMLSIPYTGSGVFASAVGMDKSFSKVLCARLGFDVAKELMISRTGIESAAELVGREIGYPCVIKPNRSGSSVGVSIVKEREAVAAALAAALAEDENILVEEFISGREFSVGVLENPVSGEAMALPVIEIIPGNEFFDYDAKYTENASQEIVPADISDTQTRAMQAIAVAVHAALGCKGYSRTDIICNDERMTVLEINTLPGLTKTSLLPKEANAIGIKYSEFIDMLIANGLRTHK